ncbi:MAG: FlxA-like family protein, partial [Lachnospiraceae bacterium]|nr:FlxA-like family protein [Lachnospiraceae bacterium]
MTINGISGQNYASKSFMMDMGSDATSKNLQSQIANAQKQMQELGSNKDMSPEAKMEKRKEIQEQINELQNQLRQHQIEQRKENLQRSTSTMEDMLGGNRQNSQPSAGGSMQAILSADSAMTQVKAQGKARAQVKGETKILKSEIRQDGARGGNVEKKQEQLEKTEARAQKLENVIVELSGKGLAAFKEYKENNRLSEDSSRKIPDEYINQLDHLHVL